MNELGFQRGMALVISLLFLLVLTIIGIVAANTSSIGLRMAGNLQSAHESFQAAEAGADAVLWLGRNPGAVPAANPFRGVAVNDPFLGVDQESHPLRILGSEFERVSLGVSIHGVFESTRSDRGDSLGVKRWEYYQIRSEHEGSGAARARTRIVMGVRKPVASGG